MIYFKYLAVNPKDRRVVVVESVLLPKIIRDKIAHVFFKRLDIPSLLIVPNHVSTLATLGISTALVLDIGYQEAIAIPIFKGITILNSIQFAPLGGKCIHIRIMDELIQRRTKLKIDNVEQFVQETLDERILEDIKFKTCFVTTFERGSFLAQQKLNDSKTSEIVCTIKKPPSSVRYRFCGNKVLEIPGSLRESVPEVLFEMYGEEHTLPTLIIDSILKCPLDCRRELASNIILVGGTSMTPGLKHRLYKEIKYLTTKSQRYHSIHFANDFRFHQLPCKEIYGSWLGASIFSTHDLLTMRSVTLEQYIRNNETMPDWSNYNFLG